ncbi:MAG: calcium-translocating P-type ATPase, PMCA-type [Defluviitaleaceae bacterium]|nr:calcium-translocating P-type ATPase, PMCA-type [Defluviitaleaceae bacterium]
MNWHNKAAEFALTRHKVDKGKGLHKEQAVARIQEHGRNVIEGKRGAPLIVRFFMQFKDFMVIVLLFAAGLSFFAGRMHGEESFAEPLVILAIVVLNAILGLVQESRAKRALAALKEISQPEAKVLRDGQAIVIRVEEIVPGDIVFLETGDIVPADLRLLTAVNLKAEEAALTGESAPVEKDADVMVAENASLGDRINMVFSGSSITYGRGRGIAVATGMNTEMGKIASLIMDEKSPETPLQRKLAETGKVLGIAALLICAIIFVIGIFRQIPPMDMFLTSVSLAVAAIPEGLVAIVTIMLAIGVTRMARRSAIIRKLPAVETLGSATVICSDKTGTLTQNRMRIVEISSGRSTLQRDSSAGLDIIKLGALCNDSFVSEGQVLGDPTEAAFITSLLEYGLDKSQLEAEKQRIAEIPFDSKRKLMTTVHKDASGFMAITKGAPDVLLRRSTHYFENGKIHTMSDTRRNEILRHVEKMADKALRVLAVSFRPLDAAPKGIAFDDLEENLVFAGLVGMMDPPRPEVRDAVAICKTAGIKPVMITGDHPQTALAVARSIGIGQAYGDVAVTGADIARMSQAELEEIVEHTTVFARVSPEHKMRIVKAYQKNGHVVAMTGDGVNDAPALKAADIGCAMGINGTEVAKGAADIVLTDDNFATIVHAVEEGRGILTNIRKAVHFLLSSNIGEIITIFMAVMLGWQVPLLAIHLLWVNLVTDSLPAIALGLDPVSDGIMEGRPKTSHTGLFSKKLWQRIFLEGAMIGMLSLIAFGIGVALFDTGEGVAFGRTMAFATLSISQLVHAFNMRSESSILRIPIFENRYLVGALIVGIILQVSVISIAPIASIFRVVPLPPDAWIVVAALSLLPIIIVEIEKFLLYPHSKQSTEEKVVDNM